MKEGEERRRRERRKACGIIRMPVCVTDLVLLLLCIIVVVTWPITDPCNLLIVLTDLLMYCIRFTVLQWRTAIVKEREGGGVIIVLLLCVEDIDNSVTIIEGIIL